MIQGPGLEHTGLHPPAEPTQPDCAVRETMLQIDGPNIQHSVDYMTATSLSQPHAADSTLPEDSTGLVHSSKQHTQAVNKPGRIVGAPSDGSSNHAEDTLKLAQKSRSHNSHDADVLADAPMARMCISLSTQPVDVCALTHLLDTACMPPDVAQRSASPMDAAQPLVQEVPRTPQQPELPHEQPPAQVDDPLKHQAPAYHRGSVHDTAAAALGSPGQPRILSTAPLPADPPRSPHSPAVPVHHPLLPPPVAPRSSSPAASHLVDHIEDLLASRDVKQVYTSLRRAMAHPHGALVVWAVVLTPLLSIFFVCFSVSMALSVTCAVLSALSSICSASSHFTMQRLGAVARRLLPHSPEPTVRAVGIKPVDSLMSSR